ncbi:MAG TPA: HAMP domain-containing sensor histidine kinase [Polyangiaceae bacterium]|nr:HAMP domain-containing sensor histidine kinase [Polyangiaceae bacterium]
MKLALRFLLATFLGILLVVAASTALNFRRELKDYDEDSQRDHRVLAHALVPAFLTTWDREGQPAALRLLGRVNLTEETLQSRWIPMSDPGSPSAQLPRTSDGLIQVVQPSPQGGDMVTFAPVDRSPPERGYIEIRESLAPRQRYVTESVVRAVLGGAGIFAWCTASCVLLGFLLVLRPVRALVAQARQIGAGRFDTRCVVTRGDELGQLAGEMNHMADLLQRHSVELAEQTDARLLALNQLRHADRLATAGKLASGIAHELGTPLTVVMGRAKLIRNDASLREDTRRNAQIVEEQAERMTRIIRQLLDFTRAREPKRTATSASELVERVVGLLTPLAEKQGTRLMLGGLRNDALIDADSGQLEQVLTNLTMNALQALVSGGVVTFSVKAERAVAPDRVAPDDYVVIEVQDTGPGMPPQVVARVFEPFFTTKEVGEGTGLGLSVAYGIVQEHGGFFTVESAVGKGSRFCVHLPKGEGSSREQEVPEWKRLKSA